MRTGIIPLEYIIILQLTMINHRQGVFRNLPDLTINILLIRSVNAIEALLEQHSSLWKLLLNEVAVSVTPKLPKWKLFSFSVGIHRFY